MAAVKQRQMTVRHNELLKDAKQGDSGPQIFQHLWIKGEPSFNLWGFRRNYY
jgi:hypothetical protein